MIQYNRFHVHYTCTNTNEQDEQERMLYNELKERFRPYLLDADMDLYRIPITADDYGYAKQLASQYTRNYDQGTYWEDPPGLDVYCSNLIETVYSKEDFQQGAAYLINFWFFADSYEDENYRDYCERCCENQNWKHFHALVQTKPYELPKRAFKNKKYARLDSMTYAFSDEIVNLLIGQGLAEREDFWEIKSKKGTHVAYQLHPQNVFRGLAEDNQMKLLDKCENCGLECYEYKLKPYYISERTLEQLRGLNRTEEMMSMVIPEDRPKKEKWQPGLDPMYVVNKDVFLLLHKRYPRMQFIPIFPKGYIV